jgi:hypothetical protein
VHRDARRALIAGYLESNVKDHRPTRFLLNDLVRYWRTIAVDFESKMRARKGEGWGLRNTKLRLSLKALFAGGFSRSLSATGNQPATCSTTSMSACRSPRLTGSLTRSSIAAPSPGVRALDADDEFLAVLDDRAKRRELSDLGVEEATESPLLARIAELGKECGAGLLALLFDDPELRRWVREYLVSRLRSYATSPSSSRSVSVAVYR